MSRFIIVPDPINPVQDKNISYSLKELITHIVDNETRYQHPASRARAGKRILEDLDKASDGVVEISRNEDWDFLKEVVENPDCGYGRWIASNKDTGASTEVKVPTRKYLQLIDAVDQAGHSDPRKETEDRKVKQLS